jgi:hypothetical protein
LASHVPMAAEEVNAKPIHASSCRLLESLPRQVVGRWMQAKCADEITAA